MTKTNKINLLRDTPGMIHRDKHDGSKPGYTVISNQPINDKSLSLEAKGMLLCIISLPDNWEFNINGLIKRFGLTRNRATRILKELETNGYISRYRKKNEINQFDGWGWDIYEKPDNEISPKSGNADVGKTRNREKPKSENADVWKSRNRENRVSENVNVEDSEIGKSVNIIKTDNDIVLIEHSTDNDQVSTKKNMDKKTSMETNTNKGTKHCFGEYKHVLLSDIDAQNLFQILGTDEANNYIQMLDDYLESNSEKVYANHYRTILSWAKKNGDNPTQEKTIAKQYGNVFTELLREEGYT